MLSALILHLYLLHLEDLRLCFPFNAYMFVIDEALEARVTFYNRHL
jgi:hypothetical protein